MSRTPRDPFIVLAKLKDAKTTAFNRTDAIPVDAQSRYNPADQPTPVGLGYVRALMLVLTGGVDAVDYPRLTRYTAGRVTLTSSGRGYALDWTVDADLDLTVGGFTHSSGQPTYQVAVLGFVMLWLASSWHTPASADELHDRWAALLDRLDARLPRATPGEPWAVNALERELSTDPTTRTAFLAVCDALEWALRLRLHLTSPRTITVAAAPCWDGTPEADAIVTTSDLLTVAPPRTTSPAPTPTPAPESGVAPPAAPPAATADPVVPSGMVGPYIARITTALARPGATLMLVGPTSTGKTAQTIAAAHALGLGLELVTFDPGMDAQEPVGGYAPSRAGDVGATLDAWVDLWPAAPGQALAHTDALRAQARIQYLALQHQQTLAGQWDAIDGPITRWARRAIAGEAVVLFLDELARAHPAVVSLVLGLLNRVSTATLARMGLTPPDDGAAGQYHLVTAWHTRERLVVPSDRVRIVAAANLGDRYQGLDLGDPAFRRRWDAWLHLPRYDEATQRTILSGQLGTAPSDPLLTALVQTATAVASYEQRTATLLATLDVATLITWGQTIQAHQTAGQPLPAAFTAAASDVWLDRICPLADDELDPTVRDDLRRLVQTAAAPLR